MKQSKRLLAVLLSMLLILSTFTIGASAYKTSYEEPAGYDSVLDPYFTNDQAATALLDYLDDNVLEPLNVQLDIGIIGVHVLINSLDSLFDSVDDILDNALYKLLDGLTGDIEDINWSEVRSSSCRRRNASVSDLEVFGKVLKFIGDPGNAKILCKLVDNSIDLGKIKDWGKIDLGEELPLLKNIHGYVDNMVYELLILDGESSGYVEGAPDNYNLDDILQDFLNNRVLTFVLNLLDDDAVATVTEFIDIPIVRNEEGKITNQMGLLNLLPSLKASDISITSTSTYDLFINIFMALIDDIVIPYAGALILDLLEIAPDDPDGDTSYIDIAINLFVDYQTLVDEGVIEAGTPEEEVNVVEEFLRWKGVENPEKPKPLDKTNVTLEYILKVGLKKFIHFEVKSKEGETRESQLQLTEYFNGMFSDLIRMVIPMLPSLVDDFTPLTPEQEAAIDTMGDEELFAFLAKMVLEAFVDGVYFPDDCNTIKELATYTLINVCEELVHSPAVDFEDMIEKGALNPDSDQCLDVAAAVLNYYLDGQTTYEDNGNKMPTFVQLLNGCFETFLGKYASLFSMYPTETDKTTYANNPWYKLYMSVNQWIPLTNIFYGCKDSWAGMEELLMDNIIGNVLNFDINGLLGIIGRRPDSDLNKPFSQLVANLLARILNGVFKLPVEKSNSINNNDFQLNSLIIPYDYTRLDQIITVTINSSVPGYTGSLNGCGLKNTVRVLLTKLQNITQPGGVAAEALDIIANLVGILDLDDFDYMRRQFVNNFPAGQSYNINQLKSLYNSLKISDNEGLNYYDEGYEFCHTVDFEPWTYKDFKSALGDAASLIEKYDNGESVQRADITYAYYVLDRTYNDWLIPRQPEAENYYLAKMINKNPRIQANVDGSGNQLYTNRSWDAYVKAYDFAETVMSEFNSAKSKGTLKNYRQSKVNTARQELRDAIRGLKIFSNVGNADYSQLEAALRNIAFLDSPAVFTDKSVENVVEVYNEALKFFREIPYDSDFQVVVDNMTNKLNKAYNQLKTISVLTYWDYSQQFLLTDEVNSYIFGLNEPLYTEDQQGEFTFNDYMDIWFMVHPTGGESNCIDYIPTPHGNGTGTKVLLQNDNGEGIIKTEREYTIIYFGDVNGDGLMDGTDSVIIKAYAAGLLSTNEKTQYISFAGDVDYDDFLSISDTKIIEKYAVGKDTDKISQQPEQRVGNTIAFTELVDEVLN